MDHAAQGGFRNARQVLPEYAGIVELRGAVRPANAQMPGAFLLYSGSGRDFSYRDDDREETIRHRLEVYQEQTAPLVSFYADEGTLLGLDATGPVDEITERALSTLRRFMR